MTLDHLETPCLWLDLDRLDENIRRFEARASSLGVRLRPHLKTSRCLEIAARIPSARHHGITVSTLQEAEAFARAGFHDQLYAVTLPASKLSRARALLKQGVRLTLVVEDLAVLEELLGATSESVIPLRLAVEIDCGQHRTGLAPQSPILPRLVHRIGEHPGAEFAGLLTHAGQAYEVLDPSEIPAIATQEREALREAAARLEQAGLPCPWLSLGSTPTFAHVDHLEGIQEARPGVYVFQDLHQFGLGACQLEDLALTVLTTVISRRNEPNQLVVDAGALALSKDLSPEGLRGGDRGYGWVADFEGRWIPGMRVRSVCQEHGLVDLPPALDPGAFSPGTRLRILPNHACLTAAAHEAYQVFQGGRYLECWPRIQGWHRDPAEEHAP